jgi:hypothetical protein
MWQMMDDGQALAVTTGACKQSHNFANTSHCFTKPVRILILIRIQYFLRNNFLSYLPPHWLNWKTSFCCENAVP